MTTRTFADNTRRPIINTVTICCMSLTFILYSSPLRSQKSDVCRTAQKDCVNSLTMHCMFKELVESANCIILYQSSENAFKISSGDRDGGEGGHFDRGLAPAHTRRLHLWDIIKAGRRSAHQQK